jgi:hypothetical protein
LVAQGVFTLFILLPTLVLLLMDNFSAHKLAVQLIREGNIPLKWTRIEWFPANTTCIFQPLDQGIIQNWKCLAKRDLLLFLKDEFDYGRDFTKTHHVLRAIKWGIAAWDAIDSELISVGNNIILQYIALFEAYYIGAILRIAISY